MLVQLLVCFVNLVCNACDDRVSQQLAALLRLALACLHTRRRMADDKDVLQHGKSHLLTIYVQVVCYLLTDCNLLCADLREHTLCCSQHRSGRAPPGGSQRQG